VFKSFDETFPPIVILWEDYERCEETIAGGQSEWNLLKVDESLCSAPAVGVLDV